MEENRFRKRRMEAMKMPSPGDLEKIEKEISIRDFEFIRLRVIYPRTIMKSFVIQNTLQTICENREEQVIVLAFLIAAMEGFVMKDLLKKLKTMKVVKEVIDEYRKNK